MKKMLKEVRVRFIVIQDKAKKCLKKWKNVKIFKDTRYMYAVLHLLCSSYLFMLKSNWNNILAEGFAVILLAITVTPTVSSTYIFIGCYDYFLSLDVAIMPSYR